VDGHIKGPSLPCSRKKKKFGKEEKKTGGGIRVRKISILALKALQKSCFERKLSAGAKGQKGENK